MTESSPSDDHYIHLHANAKAQKQATVDRLTKAITQLEAEHREVSTFTIKEVSGLDYMAYYRNREAFQIFQEHSTHLRKEREQAKHQEALRNVKVTSRDPLLDYKRPHLVELLHEARAERDEARQQAQTERAKREQQAQVQYVELEQRYRKLLQEHMQCGVKIAKLEAQVAEYLAYMERFRSSLRREEHGL